MHGLIRAETFRVYIAGNLFFADNATQEGSTGIVIYGAEHVKVADIRIDSYTYGIKIIPGPGRNALRCTFTNVAIYSSNDASGNSGTAVTVQPQLSGGETPTAVAQISFTRAC